MKKRQPMPRNNRLLTDVELEFMTIVWRLGSATVKEVMKNLPEFRNLAYTSAATIMKILNQKGYLKCQRDSFAHTFTPIISKVEYENSFLEHTVTHVFDGEPVALVQRLLGASQIHKDEILQIEEVLKNLLANKKKRK
ncbi:MAG: BlaI/MecI/CopY family transcriptional regulator [Gammaproteobacteria bacterium]|nr:BlaI/MecI/CopY family transcriptional regulator [Gammaproteobacteria bacterium]